ncbi:golgin subfamily A member 4 isoform X2 [Orussus abietinus]|uniref:golgin subfamily A member 4 isoform X2 n=1 Tax=Orussus abietinus TaxID=222816 RepID=UPI000626ACC5|nr:golgin subfamily A member 4 isoform X2 [Orussus abietinus]
MFKKFKDKLAEEMKQSPARLQASMQQLAQAVVSPTSNSSIQDLSASNEHFSLTEDGDETPKNSPAKHGFQSIDLNSPATNSMGLSRRSSVSSITSDASSLFPIYESPGNMYHLQSDIEQSASEVDDGASLQFDRVSKDQLYSSYRKMQTKYHKYRGRYTDLANHYREMERVKGKLESLLVETQDKALKRISDLKEQCQLEQQAKAHLEGVLRNDIEEKDHLINALNTKVKLLQTSETIVDGVSTSDVMDQSNKQNVQIPESSTDESQQQSQENSILLTENAQLRERLSKLEGILPRYKDSLRNGKEKIRELTQERNLLERDFDALKTSNNERIESLEEELFASKRDVISLEQQIQVLKKREEESVLSLAENKHAIHRELEVKEEQIKQLRLELKQAIESRERLSEAQSLDSDKKDIIQDLSKGKSEALKLMQRDMQQKLIDLEEKMGLKYHQEVERNKELIVKLEKLEKENLPERPSKEDEQTELLKEMLKTKEEEVSKLQLELQDLEKCLDEFKEENENLKKRLTCTQDKENSSVTADSSNVEQSTLERMTSIEETRKVRLLLNGPVCEEKLRMLQKDCENLKQIVVQWISEGNDSMICLGQGFLDMENISKCLKDENKRLREDREVLTARIGEIGLEKEQFEIKLNTSLKTILTLEEELRDQQKKLQCFDEINLKNNKFVAEIDALNHRLSVSKEENEELVKKTVLLEKYLENMSSELGQLKEVKDQQDGEIKIMVNRNKELTENLKLSQQTTVELEDLRQRYESMLDEVAAVSMENKELKERSNELAMKLSESENTLKLVREFEEKVETLEGDKTSLLSEMENLKTENKGLKEKSNELSKKFSETESLLKSVEELQQQLSILKLENQKLKDETQELSINLEQSRKEREELSNVVQQLQSQCDEYVKESALSGAKISELQERNQELRDLENSLRKLIDSNESTIQFEMKNLKEENFRLKTEYSEETSQLQNQLDTALSENIELKEKISLLEKMKEENSALIKEMSKSKVEHSELKAQLDTVSSENVTLMGRISSLEEMHQKFLNQKQELKAESNLLVSENKSLRDQIEGLKTKITERNSRLQAMKEMEEDLQIKLTKLRAERDGIKEMLDSLKCENDQLRTQENSLRETMCLAESKKENLQSEIEKLGKEHLEVKSRLTARVDDVLTENAALQERIFSLEKELQEVNETLKDKILNAKEEHSEESLRLKAQLDKVLSDKAILDERINSFEKINQELREKEESAREAACSELRNEISRLETERLAKESHSKTQINETLSENIDLKERIASLEKANQELGDQRRILEESLQSKESNIGLENQSLRDEMAKMSAEYSERGSRLEAQLDEALLTFQAREAQMRSLNDELRAKAENLEQTLKTNEDEQSMRLKQLVKEFQAQLHDKDEAIQAALEKRFDRQQNYETDLIQQYKEQLKDFQVELTEKSELIEGLILEKKELSAQRQSEIEKLSETIASIKKEHANELRDLDRKWKTILKQKTEQLEVKHGEEINELTKEWHNERRELESTSRVAMAAVQSNTGSLHSLQQTLVSQRRELAELRKLVKLRHDTLEDSTEIEYLRNILFEYMMGRETMVLARVISAVVKFDQEQTARILKREEDKLTLLGSLGLT